MGETLNSESYRLNFSYTEGIFIILLYKADLIICCLV